MRLRNLTFEAKDLVVSSASPGGREGDGNIMVVIFVKSFEIGHTECKRDAIIVHSEQERSILAASLFLFSGWFLPSRPSPRVPPPSSFSSTFGVHDLGASTGRRDFAVDSEDDIR